MTNPLMFFRLLLAAFLLSFGAQHALAQKVLLLTTNIAGPNAEQDDAIRAYTNLQNEFSSQLASTSDLTRMSVLGNANAISATTFTDAPGPYDIVIVAGTYRSIDDTNWAVLQNAVANRWANSIVFFVDGCCEGQNSGNGEGWWLR
nr:hypothetical protein [Comamonas koreensis]